MGNGFLWICVKAVIQGVQQALGYPLELKTNILCRSRNPRCIRLCSNYCDALMMNFITAAVRGKYSLTGGPWQRSGVNMVSQGVLSSGQG